MTKPKNWQADTDIVEALPSQKLMLLIDLNLTPYELALFMVILNQEMLYGQCIRNTKGLRDDAHISEGSVIKAKQGLLEKGLIKIEQYKSDVNGHIGHSINTYMTDKALWKALL